MKNIQYFKTSKDIKLNDFYPKVAYCEETKGLSIIKTKPITEIKLPLWSTTDNTKCYGSSEFGRMILYKDSCGRYTLDNRVKSLNVIMTGDFSSKDLSLKSYGSDYFQLSQSDGIPCIKFPNSGVSVNYNYDSSNVKLTFTPNYKQGTELSSIKVNGIEDVSPSIITDLFTVSLGVDSYEEQRTTINYSGSSTLNSYEVYYDLTENIELDEFNFNFYNLVLIKG